MFVNNFQNKRIIARIFQVSRDVICNVFRGEWSPLFFLFHSLDLEAAGRKNTHPSQPLYLSNSEQKLNYMGGKHFLIK